MLSFKGAARRFLWRMARGEVAGAGPLAAVLPPSAAPMVKPASRLDYPLIFPWLRGSLAPRSREPSIGLLAYPPAEYVSRLGAGTCFVRTIKFDQQPRSHFESHHGNRAAVVAYQVRFLHLIKADSGAKTVAGYCTAGPSHGGALSVCSNCADAMSRRPCEGAAE